MPLAALIRISGEVQGVGLRYTVLQYALAHHLKGWIKNEPDDTVTCYFNNKPEEVENFLNWLKLQKNFPRITKIELEWVKELGCFNNFTIKY